MVVKKIGLNTELRYTSARFKDSDDWNYALNHLIDKLNKKIAELSAWFSLLLVIMTSTVVILRYVFDIGFIALQELILYLHAAMFLLGSAYTLSQDGHVRVDVFYSRFNARKQALVNLAGCLLMLLPMCCCILYYSLPFAWDSWQILEGSVSSTGLPLVFIFKSLIPLFASLMILQTIAQIIKHWQQFKSPERS